MCIGCHMCKPYTSFGEKDMVNGFVMCRRCQYRLTHALEIPDTSFPSMESDLTEKDGEHVCKVCWEVLGERFDVCCVHCRHVIDTINKNRNTLRVLVSLSTLK